MALRPEIASILTEEVETLVRVHAGREPLPSWVTKNQAIIQTCDRIKALVVDEEGRFRATQGQPDSGKEVSDAFNAAFLAWENSSPDVSEYVLSTGYSVAGLQNMLFHFFKAGHDHAVKN